MKSPIIQHLLPKFRLTLSPRQNRRKADKKGKIKFAEGYAKIPEKLTADYGDGQRPIEYSGEGIKGEISWSDGSDQLWAIYGTDLWDKESGVNEMIVSRSIER
ncbi:hypothetical protein [uncultured Ruminococcus sp.]|uniref:hypothetical protein n=1 Tax=uncultured Ruminococcus sp. TaxID=165186 RepID=UPI0025DD9DD8|nr:hypothetical protein [uncultured Ruminococcus sp.]